MTALPTPAGPRPGTPSIPVPRIAPEAEAILEIHPELRADLATCTDPSVTPLVRAQARMRLWQAGVIEDDEPAASVAPPVPGPTLKLTGEPTPPISQGNPAPSSATPMPVNHAAEWAVLAHALADNARLDAELADVQPEHLHDRSRRVLFETMRDIHGQGQPFDGAVLMDALSIHGLLTRTEAALAVGHLATVAPDPRLAARHAEIVVLDARRRAALRTAELLRKSGGELTPIHDLSPLRDLIEGVAPADGWAATAPELSGGIAPFPLHVFPQALHDFVASVAASIPCPIDFVAVPCIAAASAALGRSLSLRVKPGYVEEANLWLAIVGKPGTAKTGSMRAAIAPLARIQGQELFDNRMLRAMIADRQRKARDKARARGGAADIESEDLPPPRRILADDITRETIAPMLRDNPRGVIVACDEISGWLNSMNQYKNGGGDDRQFFLKNYSRVPILVDRKGQEGGVPIWVADPFLSILGGVQPDLLSNVAGAADDGFRDRVLFTFPAEVAIRWCDETVDSAAAAAWETAIQKLWSLELLAGDVGDLVPYELGFSDPARERYAAYFNANAEATRGGDFPSNLTGHWAKLRGLCARLALLCEALTWVFQGKPRTRPRCVGRPAVESAVALADYFGAHHRRVLEHLAGTGADNEDARAILAWLANRKVASLRFTTKQVADNFRRRFRTHPEGLEKALAWLDARGHIRRVPAIRADLRRRHEVYEIHPSLLGEAPAARADLAEESAASA